ncbi:MAG: bifunctional 5,10-methylenetetrahydrofolate dehydrogenase/5,10-methenyltetrahydrofolate cyclohydrolase [Chlamydiia bacterium]|nr:bifunctional 5,10-methylenetetrahydrofolate dehydrogenase/5,10-methenyltetrahydrofolate cyclohydrolase [Chlamydiia bacterium]
MIINGRQVASTILSEIAQQVALLKSGRPKLAFLLVGEHPASQTYVRSKKKACAATGIESTLIALSSDISQEALLSQIALLNIDSKIDGILVQLPLPPHIDARAVMRAVDPAKDVDGFHPLNLGKLLLGEDDGFCPCTPQGIKTLLEKQNLPVNGKKVVIVGRSNIVGKPLAALLMQKKPHCNATVTIAHSHSEHLTDITLSADILIAAIGKPLFIKKEMVRPGAIVIDVGINRLNDQTIVGDVDFTPVSAIASHITPVPGGVGPMTIAMLLQNTYLSHIRRHPWH